MAKYFELFICYIKKRILWRSTSNYLFVILKKEFLWRSTSNYLFVILKKKNFVNTIFRNTFIITTSDYYERLWRSISKYLQIVNFSKYFVIKFSDTITAVVAAQKYLHVIGTSLCGSEVF